MYPVHEQFPPPPASHAGTSPSLTYEPFYGLKEKPFSLSADHRFLFRSPTHEPAFDEIHAGIQRREGLIVLTGEIGTGKTTLCRSVLHHLDRRTFAAFIADPFVSREDLLKTLLVDFGVISIGDLTRGRFNGASRSDLSYPLYEFLDSLMLLQAFAVVVIDEAQNLSLPLLEEIRILSELERREKLLQVVLVGQPELRSNLRLPEMRQVDQRVSVRCELTPLDAAGVTGYVHHRLRVAGRGECRVAFTRPALDTLFAGSSGVPRLINRICDRALQRAFASRTMQVEAELVWRAIDDLGLSTAPTMQDRALPPQPASAIALRTVAVPAEPAEPSPEVQCPAPVPATASAAPSSTIQITTPSDFDLSALARLKPEKAPAVSGGVSGPWGRRYRWLAAASAALAVSASLGAPAWYSRTGVVDGRDLTAMVPPSPMHSLLQPVVLPPYVEASSLPTFQADVPAPFATAGPTRGSTAASSHSGFSIVVASFQNRDRAERLVEELVNAGYGARTVDREGGRSGRLVQVTISGYTSALDVQRDLQRIRELPGGYSDARVIGQD